MLVGAFYRYLTPLSDNRRYDWLYLENPDGPARVWIAYDTDEKKVVGSGGAIPRRISVGGSELLACIMADFWIDPQIESFGPSVAAAASLHVECRWQILRFVHRLSQEQHGGRLPPARH